MKRKYGSGVNQRYLGKWNKFLDQTRRDLNKEYPELSEKQIRQVAQDNWNATIESDDQEVTGAYEGKGLRNKKPKQENVDFNTIKVTPAKTKKIYHGSDRLGPYYSAVKGDWKYHYTGDPRNPTKNDAIKLALVRFNERANKERRKKAWTAKRSRKKRER